MAARNPGGEKRFLPPRIASRISHGHFFLTVFFRVPHDGLSERRTTSTLLLFTEEGQTSLTIFRGLKYAISSCIGFKNSKTKQNK